MGRKTIRIGVRGSPLALKQAEEVIRSFKEAYSEFGFDIIKIETRGDRDKVSPLEKLEGTDFFTREIEEALLSGDIDLAVHSAKDLPDVLPEGLEIAAILKSIDPYDVLVSKDNLKLKELPSRAKIGTSSLRRRNQLRAFRKDFQIFDIRGNIEERLRKLEESGFDAIVIAAAGLIRLGLEDRITERLTFDILKPHPLQGSLAIEIRTGDTEMKNFVARMRTGKIYLVGAGPGDPQLITVKGLGLIKRADVIIYDFLVNKKLLNFAKKGAELICAGKSYLYHSMEQDDINKLLAEKAGKAKIIVRLKNGDPFIFGRGGEEAVYLSKRNIPCEVVPGVNSAMAIPSSCGIPLTHRDYASSVAIVTGHRKNDREVKSVSADTLVFLMAVANLGRIIKNLIKKGKSPDTPCILIEKGTLKNQKIVQGNLENIAGRSQKEKISPPAVFVVGKVVNIRSILNKIRKRILFTGTNPERFRHLGEILHQPMIKIAPLNDYSEVEKEIKRIDEYRWIIFTSRYGVKYFFDVFNRIKKDISRIKICAIGRATANKLKEYGIRVDCIPKKESSQGIVEVFKRRRRIDLKGKNILIPRSDLSTDYLPRALRRMGADVKAVTVYKNVRPPKVKRIDLNEIDEIVFTSPSAIKNFMDKYKKIPGGIKLKCIGEVTCARLKSYGLSGEVVTQ